MMACLDCSFTRSIGWMQTPSLCAAAGVIEAVTGLAQHHVVTAYVIRLTVAGVGGTQIFRHL